MTEYTHSPKVICLTGPRAAGKTTVAKQLASELGYLHIWLDGINGEVCEKLGIELAQVNLHTLENQKAYADIFRDILKEKRYQNIIFEGERIRFPYILHTFLNNVMNYYGEYAVLKGFSLTPELETHYQYYKLREIRRMKEYIKKNAHLPPEERSGDNAVREFDLNTMPDPEGFEVVDNPEAILDWARTNADAHHPDLPLEHADVIKVVADSTTYTPFYQTIEVGGKRIIRGMTRSDESWKNLSLLGVDFSEKRVVDLGSMHGYFSFKVEERGAAEVIGLELNPSSVDVARYLAGVRGSIAEFRICDVSRDPLPECDVMLAMNMLHWIHDLEGFVTAMGEASNELVMEIGEIQIKRIVSTLRPLGFKMRKSVKSHRPDKVIGQRYLFHFEKKY